MDPNAGQIDDAIDRPQNVISWDMSLNREIVEQRVLSFLKWTHHCDQAPV